MTCKDCLHGEECHVVNVSCGFRVHAEILCKNFKNKSDYAAVKHGEWHLLYNCANEGVYCSVCNKKVYKTDYANQKIKSPYCPNCGAKMDLKGGAAE